MDLLNNQGGIWSPPQANINGNRITFTQGRNNITNDVTIIEPEKTLTIQDIVDGNYEGDLDDYLPTIRYRANSNGRPTTYQMKYIPYGLVEAFNNGIIFDHALFNEEFGKLLNAERASKGLRPIQMNTNPLAIDANNKRTRDNASHGYLRGYNLETGEYYGAHTTSSGQVTASYYNDQDLGGWFYDGENTAGRGIGHLEELINEKKLAEQLFKQWKDSPGHYRLLMKDSNYFNNRTFHISARIGDFNLNPGSGYSDFYKGLVSNFVLFSK